jgi:hypothetical protein
MCVWCHSRFALLLCVSGAIPDLLCCYVCLVPFQICFAVMCVWCHSRFDLLLCVSGAIQICIAVMCVWCHLDLLCCYVCLVPSRFASLLCVSVCRLGVGHYLCWLYRCVDYGSATVCGSGILNEPIVWSEFLCYRFIMPRTSGWSRRPVR